MLKDSKLFHRCKDCKYVVKFSGSIIIVVEENIYQYKQLVFFFDFDIIHKKFTIFYMIFFLNCVSHIKPF